MLHYNLMYIEFTRDPEGGTFYYLSIESGSRVKLLCLCVVYLNVAALVPGRYAAQQQAPAVDRPEVR